jgi:hypothetical protein
MRLLSSGLTLWLGTTVGKKPAASIVSAEYVG